MAWRPAARAGALIAALLAPLPAGAWCLLGCDEVLGEADAAATLSELLGSPLPPGSEVTGVFEGGFQDRFVLARVISGPPGRALVLDALGAKEGQVAPEGRSPFLDGAAPFWDASRGTERVSGTLPGFPHAGAVFGEVDGRPVIWLWAFQT